MAPGIALYLAVPDTPRNLIGFIMPSPSNIMEYALLLPYDDPTSGLVKVLDDIVARLENRRADDDVAVAVADCHAELRCGHGHTAGEHGLRLERLREVNDPARATVDTG